MNRKRTLTIDTYENKCGEDFLSMGEAIVSNPDGWSGVVSIKSSHEEMTISLEDIENILKVFK